MRLSLINLSNKKVWWRWLGLALVILGLGLAVWPLGRYLYALYWQRALLQAATAPGAISSSESAHSESAQGTAGNSNSLPGEPAAPAPSSQSPAASARKVDLAWPGARIIIEKIGLQAAVVGGTEPVALARGPGHYENTALPGGKGNVAIAGHRTTYGAWFRRLDRLAEGDLIKLLAGDQEYLYQVTSVRRVAADDWSVIYPTAQPSLTLTTCDPPGSNRFRLAVRAEMVDQ